MGDSWVCCDSCAKWRRVSQQVADSLDDNTPWHCADNPDPIYNRCDVPQELTDTEIDERTGMPVKERNGGGAAGSGESGSEDEEEEGEGEEEGSDGPYDIAMRAGKLRKRPPVWQLIAKNRYLHRERKKQDDDEIMICQCPVIWATDITTVGCGENCLNRMLNIECVAKHCPCGQRCTNQAFTARTYAKLEARRAGPKGFGLFAAQDLKAGQFIVEYVGEVLEEEEYARRKEFYIATGQRHYYFMNVGNGEVIDAARKGGMGRFINHSCEPNCETQKWLVRGELSIGLFAMTDVTAGSELTFDYNFERYGDKPMKCLCGSRTCRGMIGGVQETASKAVEGVVVPDEEDEDPEPIMVTEREADAALEAILDRAVGLGWEEGFSPRLQARLRKLAAQRGVQLPAEAPAGAKVSTGGEGSGEEDSDEEIAAAAAAAKVAATGKGRSGAGRGRGGKTRRPRAPRKDPDWQRPLTTEEGSIAAAMAAAFAVPPQQPKRATSKASLVSDSEEETPSRLAAAPPSSTAPEEPSTAPKESSAAAPPRPSFTPATLIPKRSAALSLVPRTPLPRRRSEVDRRLDVLVGPSGRLRDTSTPNVLFTLRLFNLCDIGPTVSRTNGAAAATPAATLAATPAATPAAVPALTAGTGDDARPGKSSSYLNGTAAAAPAEGIRGASDREEGEVSAGGAASPGNGSGALPRSATAPPQLPPPAAGSVGGGGEGAGTASLVEDDGVTSRAAAAAAAPVQSRSRGGGEGGGEKQQQLSARQRARLADMSLLLDVVLKTQSARREFVACGLLRQLLVSVGRNTGPAYTVILRKVLRVVDSLPFTAEDLHHTRSAHGSFADVVRVMTQHDDYDVRSSAWALLRKHPVSACQRPGPMESFPSSAASARTAAATGAPGPSPAGGRGEWDGAGRGTPRDRMERDDFSGGPGGNGRTMPASPFGPTPMGRSAPHPLSRFGPHGGRGGPPPSGDRDRDRGGGGWQPWGGHGPGGYQSNNGTPREMPGDRYGGPPHPHPHPHSHSSHPMGDGGTMSGRKRSRWEGVGGPPPPVPAPGPGNYLGGRGEEPPNKQLRFGGGHQGPPPPRPSSGHLSDGGNGSYRDWDRAGPPPRGGAGHYGRGPPPGGANGREPDFPRPPSANLSDLSRGSGSLGDALPPPPPPRMQHAQHAQTQQHFYAGAPSAAAQPPISPMTDEEAAPDKYSNGNGKAAGAVAAAPVAAAPGSDSFDDFPIHIPSPGIDQQANGGGGGGSGNGGSGAPASGAGADESWDKPDPRFESFVADMVRHRVGKYEQPGHPTRLSREDAGVLFKTIRREVVAKEQDAYAERQRAGVHKPIERRKLEARIKEFVRDRVRKFRGGGGKGGGQGEARA